MPRTKISEFSATPANNTDIDSINIAEGCAPSGINDAIRELMAQLKDFQTGAVGDSFNGPIGTSTAAAGAFTTLSASSTATLSGLTASTALALDASKNIVSVTNTGTGSNVLATSPTLVTPALGTPSALVGTNITGTASGLTAGNVTTNANLTGAVTSVGNATSLGSFTSSQLATALTDETGSGSAVFATSPTLVTPILGTPTSATLTNATGLPIATGVSGLGTGIATALAVNTGSAGAPVLFNGALGTPSSGTVTNLTGTASININGTVGATTATTGAFTTLSATGVSTFSAGTAALPAITTTGDTNTGIFFPAADTVATTVGGSERMRLTSTGLGIGTTGALARLDVVGGSGIRVNEDGAGTKVISIRSNYAGLAPAINVSTNDPLLFLTNNTERARIDSSGNLGLGVTPSAYTAGKAIDISSNGGIFGDGVTFNWAMGITQNAYRLADGSFKYKATGQTAGGLEINGNTFRFLIAPSGTAGNAISFTQAMTLDSSGALLLGTTSATPANANGVIAFGGSDAGIIYLERQTGTDQLRFYTGGNRLGYVNTASSTLTIGTANYPLAFSTNDTERARIDSSGNLLVGTTSVVNLSKFCLVGDFYNGNGQTIQTTNDGSGAQFLSFLNSSGTVIGSVNRVSTTNAVVYNTTSDYRLKTVTGAVTGQGARIDALKPVDYLWKEGNQQARGFLAHEFQTVYPNSVTGDKDAVDADGNPKHQSMQAATSEVIADLVAEIQSLRQRLSAANL